MSLEHRFEQVLAEFLQAEERGERPEPSDLLRTNPELETQLRDYFRDRDRFDRLAPTVIHPEASPQPEPAPVSHFGNYAVLERLGQGGRGIVYRVSDPELNRPLAVKVLRPELRGEPDAVRRFLEEAQVMGQLQHPGIVPVHAVGKLPDGRPYFVMKLVQGRTLAQLVAARSAPAHDLPRFLVIFQQLCQAVAFAHSRGVIHRDLKPANVMVGAFAEVQVMDWGLAKVLSASAASQPHTHGRPEARVPAGPDAVRTIRSEGDGLASADGLIVGTFAYMAPEQAKGQVEELDPRTDVFGLGAVLCEILTGLPPYTGTAAWELHQQASAGDLAEAFARLDHCGADADLMVLARDCLAPERERRPPDATVVAERLTKYLAEVQQRLQRAEVEKAAAQARTKEARATVKAERRARRLTIGLGVALFAVLAALTASGLWLQWHQAEQARQAEALRRDVAVLLAQAIHFRQGAHFKEARELLEQAHQRLEPDGSPDLREQVAQALADAGLAKRLYAARQRAFVPVGEEQLDYSGAEKEYAAAFQLFGLGHEGEAPDVVAARVRAAVLRAELVAALDDWASLTEQGPRRAWLLAVARAADPNPQRDRLRQPELWRNGAELARRTGKVRVGELSPQLVFALSRILLRSGQDPIPLLRRGQARYPGDFWLNLGLAVRLHLGRQWDDAISYYRAALALRPEDAIAQFNLGVALDNKGQLDEAIRHYQNAVRINPRFARAHVNLGLALGARDRLDEAIDHFQAALGINPRDARAHNKLGLALRAKKQLDEAIHHFEAALHIDAQYANAHYNLGNALRDKGQLDAAIGHYQQAVRINPDDGESHGALGEVLLKLGRFLEAHSATRRCLQLLSERHPQRALGTQQLQRCERMLRLEGQLPGSLSEEEKRSAAADAIEYAGLCQMTKHYAAAVRLYADAFAADPKKADDLEAAHRYQAACCAARAATARKAPDKEQPPLRRQALDWLRADLALWKKQAETGNDMARALVQRAMVAWQNNPSLAGVRDKERLALLPAPERQTWAELWAKVEALRMQLGETKEK
jgi:serine/threonine-protein kinase